MAIAAYSHSACADPAHFWISTSNIAPGDPQAPDIPSVQNSQRYINIWAQPATLNSGAFNAATNPYKRLQNISLDLVANPSMTSFLTNSVVVYNPTLNGVKRFQYVHDSTTNSTSPIQTKGPDVGVPYYLDDISGFTVSDNSNGFGGSACSPSDPYCAMTPSGSPAWLVASLATQSLSDSGMGDFFLQIGARGINHVNETSSQASVVFGVNTLSVYNAHNDRETTFASDGPHFAIEAAPQTSIVNTHWTTGSGQWDQVAGGSAPSWLNNVVLDGGAGVVTVTGARQANLTTVNGGRLDISSGSSLASNVVVNAGGTVSGVGWVASDLSLFGTLAARSDAPLLVAGNANISGGKVALASGYTQAIGSMNTFTILKTGGSVSGTLSTPVGQSLGPGLSLAAITYGPQSVAVQVLAGVPGDYNGNGIVDAADYVVWRNSVGQTGSGLRADGDGSGTVDNGDYSFWRAHFGMTSGSGAVVIGAASAVPEPSSGSMLLFCALLILGVSIPRRDIYAAGR